MKRKNLLASLFTIAAMALVFGVTGGAGTASAQMIPGAACTDYWVNYNYVYPPAPPGAFSFAIECADGRIFTPTNEITDGHFTYPADPTCMPVRLHISWIDPALGPQIATVAIPVPNTVIPNAWGALRIEAKFDSKGCLEIKVSY